MRRKNNRKFKFITGLLIALSIHFVSCSSKVTADEDSQSGNNRTEETATTPEMPSNEIVEDTLKIEDTIVLPPVHLKDDYNDIALFLAGNKLTKKSPYYEKTKDSSFIEYAKSIRYNYQKYHDKQLVPIRSWSQNELSEIHSNSKEIFYPFSGPDILHALTVFPKGENFYLFGLEPVGDIPDLQNIPADSMNYLFNQLNKSISDNFSLSFFITKKMYKDLNAEYIKGTIPILLFFLSKMNYHIQNIQPAKILDDGSLEIKERSIKNNLSNFGKGVEITFVDTATNEIKKLYYFSMDLSDAGFKKHLGMRAFLGNFKQPVTTLVKSASYCLHGEKYDDIRNVILATTKYLLQDDTGIPYSFLNAKSWDISLYGKYTTPVKVFADMFQGDLKIAMDENAESVSFRFGYTKEANILLGKRK